ncbi:hypothetical protein JXA63_00355 [Candidatus Woesebacteria bacterium]|nr:hypothetical protein [Candidatus Woesebacteria bacterium]
MNRSKYLYLALTLFLAISVLYFSFDRVSKRIQTEPGMAQSLFSCDNVEIDTSDEGYAYRKNASIDFYIKNIPAGSRTDTFVKIISEENSEAAYRIENIFLTSGNFLSGSLDVAALLNNIKPTKKDIGLIIFTDIYDERGDLQCSGNPGSRNADSIFCSNCLKLVTISDKAKPHSAQDTLGIARAQEEPTQTPTPTPSVVYFKFDYPPDPETFMIAVTSRPLINDIRNLLAGGTGLSHVAGFVLKSPEDYNKPWSYHLDSKNIVLFDTEFDYCDASIRFIEDNLSDIGDIYLPNSYWCPHGSRFLEEVDDPFTSQCTYLYNGDANGDGRTALYDYAVWAYYFAPFIRNDGLEPVGDFNCDGYVNLTDYAIWAYHFSPI